MPFCIKVYAYCEVVTFAALQGIEGGREGEREGGREGGRESEGGEGSTHTSDGPQFHVVEGMSACESL